MKCTHLFAFADGTSLQPAMLKHQGSATCLGPAPYAVLQV